MRIVERIFAILMVCVLFTGSVITADVVAAQSDTDMEDLTAYWYLVTYDETGGSSERLIGSQDFSGASGEAAEIHYTDRDDNSFKFAAGVNSVNFEWSSYKIDDSLSSDRYNVIFGQTGSVIFYITDDNETPEPMTFEGIQPADSELPPLLRGRGGNSITINIYQITTKIDNSIPHRNLSVYPDSNFPSDYYNWGMKKVDTLYLTYEIEWEETPVTINAADYQAMALMGNWVLNSTYDPTVTNPSSYHGPASGTTVTVNSPGEVNFYFDAPDWEYAKDGVGLGSSLLTTQLSNEVIVYNTRGIYEVTSINMTAGQATPANAGRSNVHITYVWLGSDINQNEYRNRSTNAEPTLLPSMLYIANPIIDRNKRDITFNGAVDRSEGKNVLVGDQSSRDDDWHKWVQYFCVISTYNVNHYVMRTNTNRLNPLNLTVENTYMIGGNRGFIDSGTGTAAYGSNLTYRNSFYIGPQLVMDNRSIVKLSDIEIVINDPRFGGTNPSNDTEAGLGIGGVLEYEDVNGNKLNITLNMNDRTTVASSAWGQAVAAGRVEFRDNVTVYKTNPRGSALADGPMMFQVNSSATSANMGAMPDYVIYDDANINLRYNTLRDTGDQSRFSVFNGSAAGAGETPNVIIGNHVTLNALVDNKFNGDTLGNFTVGDYSIINVISTGDGDPATGSTGSFVRFGNRFVLGNSSVATVQVVNNNNYTAVQFDAVELQDRSKLIVIGNTGNGNNATSRMVRFTRDFDLSYGAEVYLINHGTATVLQTGNLTVDKLATLHVIGLNISNVAYPAANVSKMIALDRVESLIFYNNGRGPALWIANPVAANTSNETLNDVRVNQTNLKFTNMEQIKYWNNVTTTASYDVDTATIIGDPNSKWAINPELGKGFDAIARFNSTGHIPTYAGGNFSSANYINSTTDPVDFTVINEPDVLQTLTAANIVYNGQRIMSYRGLVGPYTITFNWNESPWDSDNSTINSGSVRYDMTVMKDVPNLYSDAQDPTDLSNTLPQLMPKDIDTGENYTDRGFVKWLDKDGNDYDVYSEPVIVSFELYGVWVFYPTYHKNFPGSDENFTVEVPYNTNHLAVANNFTQTGYRFTGWNTEADGNGTSYSSGDSVGILPKPLDLYAQWELIEYNITYVNAESATHFNPPTYNFTSEFDFTPASRSGFIFEGWFEDPSLQTPIEGIVPGMTGDINVYAGFMEKVYNLTYDLNGGSYSSSYDPVVVSGLPAGTHNLDLDTSTDPIYTSTTLTLFIGWTLDDSIINVVLNKDSTLPTLVDDVTFTDADVTVYAVWGEDANSNSIPDVLEEKYSIFYDINGGIAGSGPDPDINLLTQMEYPLNTTKKPTHSQDNGFDVLFVGWSSSNVSGILTKDDVLPATMTETVYIEDDDATVYAVWGYDTTGNGKPDISDEKYRVIYNTNDGTGGPGIEINILAQNGYVLKTTPKPTHISVDKDSDGVMVNVEFVGWSSSAVTSILTKDDDLPTT
ncbi:MAG: InlB B-repeat-containing protein, partial [Methanimicrococcus sp.]|nr:InlB B-repeat-containing protein [Methanimicrococcus sp.]